MVVLEIWISILAYIKNWLVFWSDDKELSSETEVIGWNFLKKHIMCVCVSELFVVLCTHDTYCIESWLINYWLKSWSIKINNKPC